jgi:hypothetical protein
LDRCKKVLVLWAISGGTQETHEFGKMVWGVPKPDLLAHAILAFERGLIEISEELELGDALKKELRAFRRKQVRMTGYERMESLRESDHDDLVLALALSCWSVNKGGGGFQDPADAPEPGSPSPGWADCPWLNRTLRNVTPSSSIASPCYI